MDEHRERFGGVQPICRVLSEHGWQIAPSGYWAATARPPSARAARGAALPADLGRIHADNYGVYGARKARHAYTAAARCTVERLMHQARLVSF